MISPRLNEARAYIERGLTLAEQRSDPELRSRLLGTLGTLALSAGNPIAAEKHFHQGKQLAESSGLSIQLCRHRANVGRAAAVQHDYVRADLNFTQALRLARDLSLPYEEAVTLNYAGQ